MSRGKAQPDLYVFNVSPTGQILSVAEVERNGRLDYEKIEKDETYSLIDGLVVKTELDDGEIEWTVYGDRGDGYWVELGEGEGRLDLGLFKPGAADPTAPPVAPPAAPGDGYIFEFGPFGQIVGVLEVEKNGRIEREEIERDEIYVFHEGLVTKTELEDGRWEVTTYADADGDGVWHEIVAPPADSGAFAGLW